MRRIYTALCPKCDAKYVIDELRLQPDLHNIGHDIGLAMAIHVEYYHPELFMTQKEITKAIYSQKGMMN